LIEAIFSSKAEVEATRRLLGDDAQVFIDAVDEARFHSSSPTCYLKFTPRPFVNQALNRPDVSPQTRRKCLKLLYRTCGRSALLPETLKIPVYYDRTGVALYRGGFADVWKGKHGDQDVAVKVIRVYSNSELQKLIGVSQATGCTLLLHPAR